MSNVVITEILSDVAYGSQALTQTMGFPELRHFFHECFTSQLDRAAMINAGVVGEDIINTQRDYLWQAAGGAALSVMTQTVRTRKSYKQHFVLPATTPMVEAALRQNVPAATVNLDEVDETVLRFIEYIVKPLTVYVRDRTVYAYTFVVDNQVIPGDGPNQVTARLINQISQDRAGVNIPGRNAANLNAAFSRFVAFKRQMLGAKVAAASTPAHPCGVRLMRFTPNGLVYNVTTGIDRPIELNREELIGCFLLREWFQNPIYNAVYVAVVPPVVNEDVFNTPYTPHNATDLIARLTPPEWEVECFNFIGRVLLRYWPDMAGIRDRADQIVHLIGGAIPGGQNPGLQVGGHFDPNDAGDGAGPARGAPPGGGRNVRRRIEAGVLLPVAATAVAEGALPDTARAPVPPEARPAPPQA